MNSEELELSLRTEFENYLKGVLTEMRQEVAEFQSKFEAELEKHRGQIDEAFTAFSSRAESESQFDEAFRSSVSEHLRLARDEGAKITAEAFAEAEKLEKETAPAAKYDVLRDAINDISAQDSQSGILRSLVQHAADFAPRGAFFILKNEHLVGWKVFGTGSQADEVIREIHLPVSLDTVLGASVNSLDTVDSAAGAHPGDHQFLDKLGFGHPDRMFAIPLTARGKAVAVLYADYGDDGVHLNREGLEALVRVAGLTVELHAVTQVTGASAETEVAMASQEAFQPEAAREEFHEPAPTHQFAFEPSTAYPEPNDHSAGFTEPAAAVEEEAEPVPEPAYAAVSDEANGSAGALVFDSGGSIEGAAFGTTPFDSAPQAEYSPAPTQEFTPAPHVDYAPMSPPDFSPVMPAVEPAPEPVPEKTIELVSPVVSTSTGRLSDRPVDLPIDVPEQERRLHNDARRFARLLVSEIKLYNEKKVQEGRQAHDLYDRLKEAIDRSREMYDKRVQPPVAAKFDYFHYELVSALAEGNTDRLGGGYPGATV